MKPIGAITIALFAAGTLSAIILVYQQFAASSPVKPYAISKDKAVKIALDQVDREPNRDAAFMPEKQATAKLVHVTDNGLAFVTDEDSLADMWLYSNDHKFTQSGYFWHVDVTTFNAGGYLGYYYLIEADSGQVVGNDRDPNFAGVP